MSRFALALLCLLTACAAPALESEAPEAASEPAAPVAPAAGPEQPIAESAAEFGIDLYRKLASGEGNLFFSPVSISGAFGLVQAGARGETEAEIARILHYRLPRERLHPELGAMLRGLALDQPGRRLTVANALWVQQGYELMPDYVRLLGDDYGAPPERVDFVGGGAAAAARINAWAERNTNGRIRSLLRAGDLSEMTRLVLTNTVWMKADWLRPFLAADTRPGEFFASGAGAAQVPFMHQQEPFRHIDMPDFQAIELPYRGEELAMIVFLPKARDGLAAFEASLDPSRIRRWIGQLGAAEPEPIDLALPKIRMETRYQLGRTLQEMGMRLAFSDQADFSGMAGGRDLFIDKAIHQTFLLVDEKGTEAAAATALVMNVTSAPAPPRIRFHADHPFFFLIRDNRSSAMLFMGRIAQPPGG